MRTNRPRHDKCSARRKHTHEPCGNYPRTGLSVCRIHGGGGDLTKGNRLPGRPSTHGIYSQYASPEDQENYESFFGDLTFVHELAAIKMALARMAKKFYGESSLPALLSSTSPSSRPPNSPPISGSSASSSSSSPPVHRFLSEGGGFRPNEARIREEKALAKEEREREKESDPEEKRYRRIDPDEQFILFAERVVKLCLSAQEQAMGKKLTVSFQDLDIEQEVRDKAREFLTRTLSWIPEILCESCRKRVIEKIRETQKIMVESEEMR